MSGILGKSPRRGIGPAALAGAALLVVAWIGSGSGPLSGPAADLGIALHAPAQAKETPLNPDALPSISSIWDWSDLPASEARFRDEAARAQAAGDTARSLAMKTQVARALGLQSRFEEAHAVLDTVEAGIRPDISTASTTAAEVEVRLRLERGRLWNSAGQPETSKTSFVDAFEIAVASRLEALAIDAAHMLAIVETGDAARVWFQRGVEMAENSLDPAARRWLGPLYNNYGWTLHDEGRFEEALVVFEKAVDWRRENSGPVEVRIARYAVARALRSLERCPEALPILRELEKELETAPADDGFIHEELAECLLATGRKKEAAPYFRRAYELLSEDAWLQSNQPDRLARLKELSGS